MLLFQMICHRFCLPSWLLNSFRAHTEDPTGLLSRCNIQVQNLPAVMFQPCQVRNKTKILSRWCSGKESTCKCRKRRRHRFDPWVWKIPWRMKWQPTPVFLPGKSHGQRSLAGYNGVAKSWSQHTQTHTQRREKTTQISKNERNHVGQGVQNPNDLPNGHNPQTYT